MDYYIEENLFKGLRNRESAAFEHMRITCFESIFKIANRYENCKVDAEDLYSEGIYCLLESIDEPDWIMTSIMKTLFYSICENQYLKIIRKHNSEQTYLNEPHDVYYDEHFEAKLDHKVHKNIYWCSFEKLKDDCQKILSKFNENVPLDKIAEEMNLSTNYIHKKKRKCFDALVSMVYEHPEYEKE